MGLSRIMTLASQFSRPQRKHIPVLHSEFLHRLRDTLSSSSSFRPSLANFCQTEKSKNKKLLKTSLNTHSRSSNLAYYTPHSFYSIINSANTRGSTLSPSFRPPKAKGRETALSLLSAKSGHIEELGSRALRPLMRGR